MDAPQNSPDEPAGEDDKRFESDRLGPIAVPARAFYGIRTVRCLNNMSFSGQRLAAYPELVDALIDIKKSAAISNYHTGILDQDIHHGIVAACDHLQRIDCREHFVVDVYAGGGSIAINTNVNEVVANLGNWLLGKPLGCYDPINPKLHVNASQSTADVCHTAQNIAMIRVWRRLDGALAALSKTAQHQAQAFQNIEIIARTCLQVALPARLGDNFQAFATMLDRRRQQLMDAVASLREINLGGTVIGTGAGASLDYRNLIVDQLREVSDLELTRADDLIDAAQNIDRLATISASLATLAGCLIKFAKDLRLMASGPSTGFGEIQLPEVQEGSSFFSDKINPVIPETLLQCCFLILGADRSVQACLEHGELQLNIFEGGAAMRILDSFGLLTRALQIFHHQCLDGIKAVSQRSDSYELTLAQLRSSHTCS